MKLIISSSAFLAVFVAFLLGVHQVLLREKQLPLKLFVMTAGCYALVELSMTVNYLTDGFEYYLTLGTFGIFGSFCFLLSANCAYADCEPQKTPLWINFVSGAVGAAFAVMLALVGIGTVSEDAVAAVLLLLLLSPAVPASFRSMRHLCLSFVEKEGLIRAMRMPNLCAVLFYTSVLSDVLDTISRRDASAGYWTVASAVSVVGIAVFTVTGAKKWKI